MRQYEKIWIELKKLPVGAELGVRTHHTAAKRLIQAVKLEKTKEVAVKKKIGMMRAGPLKIRTTTDESEHVVVYFSLTWDGSKL